MKTLFKYLSILSILTLIASCGKDGSVNVFSVNKDIELGMMVDSSIQNSPNEYTVIPRQSFPEAYAFIEGMKDSILASPDIIYGDRFEWKVTLLQDDETLNAFATPGGYIYIYTGLMKFLDDENELAGVLGHEIAHSDRRHSTDQLTKQYGISTLLQILLNGNSSQLAGVAANLIQLKFSRNAEAEADEYSVRYMCPTAYAADGASGFFAKLVAMGQSGGTPQFLSTHPDPDNRVEDIKAQKDMLGCEGTGTFSQRYQDFLATLP